MATAYTSDNYLVPMPAVPGVGISLTREFLWTIAAALVVNDTCKLCVIPGKSVMVLEEWFLDVPDLDAGATPTLTFDLGDTDTAAKFLAASTVGQAAGIKSSAGGDGVVAALPVSYSANKDLILKVHDAPQTSATSGVIKGYIRYHMVGVSTPV